MRSLSVFPLWLLLWASAALCATPPPGTNAAAAPRGRIVILGDSLTAGFGLPDLALAYPALLQAKIDAAGLPYTVANAGVSGDTTAGGLRRVGWALGPGAEVLVIALGGNDGLRGLTPKQTEANLAGIVAEARVKVPGIRIAVAGMEMPPSMGADFAREFHAVFPRVAEVAHVALIPFLLQGVGGDPKLNQADGIHPTAAGQEIVAVNVWKVLEPLLRK